ncbi:PGPGW domain-containing protein [Siccirubricoccus phaeus]|uniref:PGPGW domain-containing protein n=1 Tax=Siccirubricoccus phaeus TaxID=2595053 RepID=UPI0011F1B62C|nr:PGPGW domain-containing protein [Siccirubricoccus phaeus]
MLRTLSGLGLLVLGVLGLVLPVLQGGLFIALGLFILRHRFAWARRAMAALERRWPNAVHRVEAMEGRLIAWGRRQGEGLRERLRRLRP